MADWKDGEKGAHGWVSSSLCPGQPQPPLDRSFLDSSHTALSLSLQPSGGDAPPTPPGWMNMTDYSTIPCLAS